MFLCRRIDAACLQLLVILSLLSCVHVAAARPAPATLRRHVHGGAALHPFNQLLGARRGDHVTGLADLKRYLVRFGHMHANPGRDATDNFDEHLEDAVKRYQARLSLPVTGRLDAAMLDKITSPRCGVGDGAASTSLSARKAGAGADSRNTFLTDEQRSPMVLTYALSPTATVDYLQPAAVRAVLGRAFARWAQTIPVSIVETEDYDAADITVGFYEGEHNDGDPFDGPLNTLAHALPDDGRIHFDAAERWAVDLDADGADTAAFDLESVATHEIGHILGLEHSASPRTVMYPYMKRGIRKVHLSIDDIQGVQALYGANPQFSFSTYDKEDPDTRFSSHGLTSWLARSPSWVIPLVVVALAVLIAIVLCATKRFCR